jgi:NAD(P)H-hydrate epimerase
MSGAARICAEAGARTGAGLISIATHPEHANWLNIDRPELMVKAIHSVDDLTSPLAKASVISFGPGLGQNAWSETLFNTLINTDKPMVIDADALNLLSQHPHNKPNWILTPHPGEAARLLGTNSSEIEADRFQAVKQIQQKYGGVVVLKGAGTLICDGQTTLVSTAGNPGMASGGMGDALTGIIGGLLAQKMSLFDAASLGVILHGMAADRAAKEHGERGLLALDLLPHLRHLLNSK